MNKPLNIIDVMHQRLSKLHPVLLNIIDDSADHIGHGAKGGHYTVIIESPDFIGKATLQRHKMVYAALEGLIGQEIHAIQINARAPQLDK